jgi:hypothetical protein
MGWISIRMETCSGDRISMGRGIDSPIKHSKVLEIVVIEAFVAIKNITQKWLRPWTMVSGFIFMLSFSMGYVTDIIRNREVPEF